MGAACVLVGEWVVGGTLRLLCSELGGYPSRFDK